MHIDEEYKEYMDKWNISKSHNFMQISQQLNGVKTAGGQSNIYDST